MDQNILPSTFFIVAKNNCNYFLIVYYLQIKSLHCYVLAEIAVQ